MATEVQSATHVSEMPRAPVNVKKLTDDQCELLLDARWARSDPEVEAKYMGEFVVAYKRAIIAHGHDMKAVREEAARKTGRKPEEFPVIGLDDPLQELPH